MSSVSGIPSGTEFYGEGDPRRSVLWGHSFDGSPRAAAVVVARSRDAEHHRHKRCSLLIALFVSRFRQVSELLEELKRSRGQVDNLERLLEAMTTVDKSRAAIEVSV